MGVTNSAPINTSFYFKIRGRDKKTQKKQLILFKLHIHSKSAQSTTTTQHNSYAIHNMTLTTTIINNHNS